MYDTFYFSGINSGKQIWFLLFVFIYRESIYPAIKIFYYTTSNISAGKQKTLSKTIFTLLKTNILLKHSFLTLFTNMKTNCPKGLTR